MFAIRRGVSGRRGFSLIEFMVVLGIIGVLSGIAINSYSRYQTKVVVSGEVSMMLSPWIRDCRSHQHDGSACWPCFGISHNLSFEPGQDGSVCHVSVKRAGPNVSVGEWVSVRVADTGSIIYEGPLAGYMR